MKTVTVKDRQTLFDIAIQCLGIVDRVFDVAQLNGLAITDQLVSGQVLMLPDVNFEQADVVDFFTHPWYPASGDDDNELPFGGIGFMQIGSNFKVS